MAKILVLLWLAGLSIFDIRHKSVPVWMVIMGAAGIIGWGICGYAAGRNNDIGCLLGMVPGAVLLLLAISTRKVGWVDGVILLFLGSILGIQGSILTALFSLILISTLSILLLVLHKADKNTRIPYIPFLTAGFILFETVM